MKHIPLLLMAMALVLAACDPGGPSSYQQPVGGYTPLPGASANCLQNGYGGGGCQQMAPMPAGAGWQPYPASGYGANFMQNGFTACGGAQSPVFMGSGSTACVGNEYFRGRNYGYVTVDPGTMSYQQGGSWNNFSAFMGCSLAATDQFGNNWNCAPGYYCEPANGNRTPYGPSMAGMGNPTMGICRLK